MQNNTGLKRLSCWGRREDLVDNGQKLDTHKYGAAEFKPIKQHTDPFLKVTATKYFRYTSMSDALHYAAFQEENSRVTFLPCI